MQNIQGTHDKNISVRRSKYTRILKVPIAINFYSFP